MESGNTTAKDDARQPKDALVLYEPDEDSGEDKHWILLHVLLRLKEGSSSSLEPPTSADGLLRLANSFNDWCKWRDENAQVVTGTIIFSEAPKDMLIESLFIEKPYRRQGFGRRLVEGMRTVCRQRGRSRMLAATQFRAKAMPFWLAMGLVREPETGTPFIPVDSSDSS
jgi:GNAT superfamily N-acetyltransferase